MIPIYLILGAEGSGRRHMAYDLIDGGCSLEATIAVCTYKDEVDIGDVPSELPNVSLLSWVDNDGAVSVEGYNNPVDGMFFISNGRADPSDQVERFKEFLDNREFELVQIITVVNCQLAQEHLPLLKWYDACIHFSDTVLLNKREEVPQAWINGFVKKYEKECYPCRFEHVKKGKVRNPAALLDNIPRRISSIFDPGDVFDDFELDGDDLPDEPFDIVAKPDRYLERLPGGKRSVVLPDITQYL